MEDKGYLVKCCLCRLISVLTSYPVMMIVPGTREGTTSKAKFMSSFRVGQEGSGNPLQYSCWKSPWMEEPGGLQSMGSLTVRHD